jgi:hypothetical protein
VADPIRHSKRRAGPLGQATRRKPVSSASIGS